ncbi:hypothetical protein [Aeromicrobium sp. CTD01-1L150]|uniref:hypothetical protein n=1 Tax=Aeromicrobium sp. CTD01-1L150 TaxID=3341830 RepID=UPI0035BF173F
MRRFLCALSAGTLAMAVMVGVQVVTSEPAAACPTSDPNCDSPGETTRPDPARFSDGTQRESITTPKRSCSVYANGSGMGSFCVTLGGGGVSQTLRERFAGQDLQRCRYGEIPGSIERPYNANPDRGRYMLMRCLNNIDFDTYSGGTDRTLDISIVFVPNGTDTSYDGNPLSDFLWRQINNATRLPAPFMVTRPNPTPLVGTPTFFTFRWINPVTEELVAQGPYADREQGGPFREIEENGFTMQAQATSITIDPNQEGIDAVTCDPDTPYIDGADPDQQPAEACSITFPRSSASARELATEPIPDNVDEAFHADIEVRWEVRYGEQGEEMRQLGDGFTMRLQQVIPVQEVQAANQPPIVVF